MSESSDSEEFYDAEELTPIKGSKRSSICKSTSVVEDPEVKDSDKRSSLKVEAGAGVAEAADAATAAEAQTKEDEKAIVKNVVKDRRKFQELRRCLQSDDEEETVLAERDVYEQPFKMRAQDTVSLQSMTSLGRIGRILGGTSESHCNLRESAGAPPPSPRAPAPPDDPAPDVSWSLTGREPDVIASTKANSLKHGAALVVSAPSPGAGGPGGAGGSGAGCGPAAAPVPPPRRRRRNKLHGSQSLSAAEDTASVCTTDTEDCCALPPHLPSDSAEWGDVDSLTRRLAHQITHHADFDASSSPAARPRDRSERGSPGSTGRSARHADPPALSDMEILEQVSVLNLDTGERVPLSVADEKLPQCINPLSLHIMRLTSQYNDARETDEESECARAADDKEPKPEGEHGGNIKRKTDKLRRLVRRGVRRAAAAARSLADARREDVAELPGGGRLRASLSHRAPYDFDGTLRYVQELPGAAGAVWCCKASACGRLLATAGQDRLLRVWVARDARDHFQEMRKKYNAEEKSSPSPSQETLHTLEPEAGAPPPPDAPYHPRPLCVYVGHGADLLDVAWSKNYFLLSSSMDKTVRLWHVSRSECLCCFQHIDFVTAIAFHPRDDRYFLSGSLDGKLRLWDIPDKKVAVWNEVDGKTKLITAANFCQNGKFAVVGTYDGRCIFYTTDQLKYHTQIDVRSTRGKNSTGRKISGVEPMPNDDKILVTSNDSRIRLYDLRDLNLSCKYKGYVNVSSQIKASFSHDGKYIVSGSENQCIYIWRTYHDYSKFTSVRRDRNDYWEGVKAHNAVVTCAVFVPNPDRMIKSIDEREEEERVRNGVRKDEEKSGEGSGLVAASQSGHVLVSADFNGVLKVFLHRAKPKHSSLPASALA